jgi:ribulose-5-phosphate 4-epimerase/fuculose-1-phosphate aldolase
MLALGCGLIAIWRRHVPSLQAFQLRGAGAVLHSHSTNAVMATMLDECATEFHVTQLEMVKVGGGPASHW